MKIKKLGICLLIISNMALITFIIFIIKTDGVIDVIPEENYKAKQELEKLGYTCGEKSCSLEDIKEVSVDSAYLSYGNQYNFDFEEKKYTSSWHDLQIDNGNVRKVEKCSFYYYWDVNQAYADDMVIADNYYVYNCQNEQIYNTQRQYEKYYCFQITQFTPNYYELKTKCDTLKQICITGTSRLINMNLELE